MWYKIIKCYLISWVKLEVNYYLSIRYAVLGKLLLKSNWITLLLKVVIPSYKKQNNWS